MVIFQNDTPAAAKNKCFHEKIIFAQKNRFKMQQPTGVTSDISATRKMKLCKKLSSMSEKREIERLFFLHDSVTE